MAILAMCFDLMQDEIVAKFYWIGTKIGIVEGGNGTMNQTNSIANVSNISYPQTSASNININTMSMRIDDENENELSTQDYPNETRKLSSRNKMTRIHPIRNNESNEGTLHQRITSTKFN